MRRETGAYSSAYVAYAMFVVFLVAVFNVVDRMVVSILATSIERDLGLSDAQLGWLLGPSFAVVHFVAILPFAWLADRTARRTIIAFGLFVWSGMTALGGAAQGFGQLFATRMGVGIGEAAGSPPSASLLTDTAPPHLRSRALSALTLGALMGIGVGLVAGGALAQAYGWRTTLVAIGAPGVLVALLVRFTWREPPRSARAASASPLDAARHLFRLPTYGRLVGAASFAGMASLGRNMWEPVLLERVFGFALRDAGLQLFLFSALPAAGGAWLGGWLADRLGRRDVRWPLWVCAIGNAACAPLLVAFLLWPADARLAGGTPVAFLFLAGGALLGGFYSPPTSAVAQSLSLGHMRAMAHAIWSMVFTLVGQGVGPTLVGQLNVALGPAYGAQAIRYSMAVVSGLALVAAAGYFAAARSLPADLARVRSIEDADDARPGTPPESRTQPPATG